MGKVIKKWFKIGFIKGFNACLNHLSVRYSITHVKDNPFKFEELIKSLNPKEKLNEWINYIDDNNTEVTDI